VAVLAVVLVGCSGADEQAVEPTVPRCTPDVAIVAVRGSTEPLGLAGPAGVASRAVAAGLGDAEVTTSEVGYPAALQGYDASVREGAAALGVALDAALAGCATTTAVAIGYSQGAQVVGEALRAATPSTRERVGAVVLLGDPTRDADDPAVTTTRGGADVGSGGGGLLGARSLPGDIAARTLAWCADGDPICDAEACTQGVLVCLLAGPGLAAHGDYPPGDAGIVTAFAADLLGPG
jgi:hypothetical protein